MFMNYEVKYSSISILLVFIDIERDVTRSPLRIQVIVVFRLIMIIQSRTY